MGKILDLACMTVTSGGTGTLTLGIAAANSLTFAQAGANDGDVVTYAIQDSGTAPTAREIGRATYNAAGPTLSNRTVLRSTNANAPISASAFAFVFSTVASEDVSPSVFSGGPSEVSIRAARAAAVAAGGGTIMLPAGVITLAAPLPCDTGLSYVGTPPEFTFSNSITETAWSFSGGTVFVGDGTFPAFAQNNTSRASPDVNFLDNATSNFSLRNIGFQSFSRALDIGAHNNVGLIFSELSNLWALSCTSWGFNLVNFHHLRCDNMFTNKCGNGQRYAQDLLNAVLSTGNSNFYHLVDQGTPTAMLNRGIVFEGLSGGFLDEINVSKVQQITFGRSQLSQTATFNGTSTIAVTDGTKFAVGLPVSFTATAFGIVAATGLTRSITYMVQSVAGNNITIALNKGGSVFVAGGSGTLTITSWGMPCMEGGAGDTTSALNNSHFIDLDLESNSEAVLYVQNSVSSHYDMRQVQNVGAQVGAHFVGRNASSCDIYSAANVVTDIDTGTVQFYGTRAATLQLGSMGIWVDSVRGTRGFSLTGLSADIENHIGVGGTNVLVPQIPFTQFATFITGTGYALFGSQAGYLSAATANATYSLPTIQNSAGSPSTANVGLQHIIDNNTTGTITINTDGSQLLNAVGGATGIVIPKGQCVKFTAMQGSSFYWLTEQVIKPGITNIVADLPAAAAALAGFRAMVTNALGPSFGSAVVGGGGVTTPVICTGAAWNVG